MNRIRLIGMLGLVPLLLLPGSAMAGTAAGDSVVGSGWRLLDGTPKVWFEISARSDVSGGNAHGTYSFNFPDLGVSFAGEVTCLRVVGTAAVIGGRITESQGLSEDQVAFAVWVKDGGIPAGGQPGPDQVSTTAVLAEAPAVCPSLELPSSELWRAVKGSLAVRDR